MAAEGDLSLATSARADMARERPSRERPDLELLFRASIVVCAAATVVVLLPGVHGHAAAPAVDLILDTIALLVSTLLTGLAWARFRERSEPVAIYHAAAFLALAVAYGIGVVVSLQHSGSIASLGEPVDAQVLVFAIARLGAAILFVIGGAFTGRRSYGWFPTWILAAPTLAVIVGGVVAQIFGPPTEALEILRFEEGSQLPDITPFGAALHLVTTSLFFAGAYASRRVWRVDRAVIYGWIAIGLVFAGFAELQWALYPSAHPGQVSTGDLLWLACFVVLLLGLEASVRRNLRDLRAANVELAGLRDADAERAALEERARLARELHDGLAQDLWLAKLRTGQVATMDDLPSEARHALEEAGSAIDSGLADAREAVAALRNTTTAHEGLCNRVRRSVDEFSDRFGLRVEFAFEGEHTTRVAARTQAEVLRIAHEALANVARHADATVVGVRLEIREDRIWLRVVDNGRGFDVASRPPETFGLASMRERAALIGGRLRVLSRPGAGTRVVLSAPFAPPVARPAGSRP
jgi:signal transduction histidine kinase